MRQFPRAAILTAVLATGVVGCGGDIFRTFKLNPDVDEANSIVTDARQRVITVVSPGIASRPGLVDAQRIMCVEPSPDVAVAVANSLGGGLSIIGKGSFSISGAEAEGLAQIAERTTAIQAIMRQGYQACIDYMNGAISGTTYSLRQSRLDDMLVTLVLAEDAAGAFGRSGAAIGTEAAASARAAASMLPDISKSLQEANNDLSAKQQDVSLKEQELAELKKTAAAAAPADKPAADKAVQDKQKELNSAIAARDAALRSTTGLSEAASNASAGVTTVVGQGGLVAQPNPEIARAIAQMQDTFVNKDMEQAYLSTCLTELGLWKNRDTEDNVFRQIAIDRIARAAEDPAASDLSGTEVGDYFLAAQLGQTTRLTEHCEENLDAFIFQAQANENARKVMRLQIEAQRIELEREKFARGGTALGVEMHPEADLKVAIKANEDLTAAEALLAAANVPTTLPAAQQQQLAQDQKAALERAAKIVAEGKTLLEPNRQAAKDIEAKFLALVTDPRRTSGGQSPDREDWQSAFNIQQQEAAILASKFTDFTRRAQRAKSEVESVLRKIAPSS